MTSFNIHADSLETSTAISRYYVEHFIAPLEVIAVLNRGGVKFVLVGTHGLGGWMQKPRASSDVDILTASRGHHKAVRALLAAFPELEVEGQESPARLRHRDSRNALIEVFQPRSLLFQEALKQTIVVEASSQEFKIPCLEMALAMKFADLLRESWADPKKYQGVHDFLLMARVNADIDLKKLAQFGKLIFPGGGKEIVEKVRQVQAGEKLNL